MTPLIVAIQTGNLPIVTFVFTKMIKSGLREALSLANYEDDVRYYELNEDQQAYTLLAVC